MLDIIYDKVLFDLVLTYHSLYYTVPIKGPVLLLTLLLLGKLRPWQLDNVGNTNI